MQNWKCRPIHNFFYQSRPTDHDLRGVPSRNGGGAQAMLWNGITFRPNNMFTKISDLLVPEKKSIEIILAS